MNTMIINKNFNVIDYVSLVKGLAEEYFTKDGEYVPYYGTLNAMRLFYNKCVIESKFELPHDFEDALQMDILVNDEEFIKAFNEAIEGDGTICLDFSNAYAEAMKIVDANKNSFNYMTNTLKAVIGNGIEKINSIFSEETVATLASILNGIADNSISTEVIANALKIR